MTPKLLILLLTATFFACAPPPAGESSPPVAQRQSARTEDEGGRSQGEGEQVQQGGVHPAYGMTFKDLEGNEVSLKDFKGKVVLLDLWATWCPPCVETIPKLEKLSKAYEDKNFVVVGLNYDENPKKVKGFLKKKGATYHAWIGTVDQFEEMDVFGLPTAFLLGRDGQLIKKWIGYAEPDAFAKQLKKILEEEAAGSDA